MSLIRLMIWASALWILCWVDPLLASETDAAAAEVLFQEGRSALSAGEYDKACLNFEESLRLQAAVGTVMNLATCEEKRGRYASSWERWQQALRLLEPGDRRRDHAKQRAEATANRVSQLTLSPQPGWNQRLVVMSGGVRLGEASYGRPLPVDPGERLVTVEAQGRSARSYRINLKPGERRKLLVEPGPALQTVQGSPNTTSKAGQTHKVLAFAAAGVGVAGLGTAIITAALLPGMKATVDDNCQAKQCNEEGLRAASAGQAALTANTVGWIAAGVGLATAGVLLFTLPHDNENQAKKVGLAVSPAGASLQFRGKF